jgi:hypothetical protein
VQETSQSDVRVEAQSLHARVEKLAVGDWEQVRGKLPQHLSFECRQILEGMLEVDEDRRLTTRQIFTHPFMRKGLAMTPLCTRRQGKEQRKNAKSHRESKAVGGIKGGEHASPTTPTPTQRTLQKAVVNNSTCSSSSTTLRSVLQRTSPGMFEHLGDRAYEQRKTPFGIVNLVKQQEKGGDVKIAITLKERPLPPRGKTNWGNGYGTRGLLTVRQRLEDGKIEVTREGNVAMNIKGKGSILIPSNGAHVDYVPDPSVADSRHVDCLYQVAEKWLNRHRRKASLAGFMLPAEETRADKKLSGAVEYVAYCSIKGNGPCPDYQVRFAALEDGDKRQEKTVDEWNVEVQVHVMRGKNQIILHMKVQGTDAGHGFSWKKCALPITQRKPIRGRSGSVEDRWVLAGAPGTSLILQDLTKREQKAVSRSLHASHSVDSIFRALIGEPSKPS